jgi:hypothetical protein
VYYTIIADITPVRTALISHEKAEDVDIPGFFMAVIAVLKQTAELFLAIGLHFRMLDGINDLCIYNLDRIAADFSLALLVDIIIFSRDFVTRAGNLIALGLIAGIGVGTVLGLTHKRKSRFSAIGYMLGGAAPADEAEQAVDLITGADSGFVNRILEMNPVLDLSGLDTRIAAIILVYGDAPRSHRRNRSNSQ